MTRIPLLLVSALGFLMPATLSGQDQSSIWDALPAETLGAVRVDFNADFVERMKSETKFGEILFSAEKQDVFGKIVQALMASGADELPQGLEKYGIEIDELSQVISGDSGIAVIDAIGDAPDEACLVAWLTPAEDVSDRFWEAFLSWIDELSEDEDMLRVVEFDLDGYTAINVQRPNFTFDEDFIESSDDEGEFKTAFDNALLVNQDGRIVITASSDEVDAEGLDDHTRWLEDQLAMLLDGSGARDGFAESLEQSMGARYNPTPDEDIFLEAAGSLTRLMEKAEQSMPPREYQQMTMVTDMLGVGSINSGVIRLSLGQQVVRTYGFLDWPEPRRGVIRAIGQSNEPMDPPAWVPSSVTTFRQMHFDLAEIFRVAEEEAMKTFPQSRASFDLARQQVDGLIQAPLEELLDGLSTTQYVIQFAPDVEALADDEFSDAEVEPTALVWDVQNQEMWARLMQSLGAFASMANMKPTDEQGFEGFRIESPLVEGGIVVGRDKLVFALGPETLESTLSAINNPPSGRNAYRNSDVFEAAQDVFDMRRATSTEVTDGNQMMKLARQAFAIAAEQITAFEEEYGSEYGDEGNAALKLLVDLFPDEDETDGILGVVVTEFVIDEDGLTVQSINEMPGS